MMVAPAQAAETPAKPIERQPPRYPPACLPPQGAPTAPQTVTIVYAVSKEGRVEDARVREASDACFNEAALEAVRDWRFEPRKVDGEARAQEDLEATLKFVLNEATQAEDFDAAPIIRYPPRYPERCIRRASSKEIIHIGFDVTREGTTENIHVIDSSNSCMDKAAMQAVEKWRYHPKTVNGEAVVRKGVETEITLELAGGSNYSNDERVRSEVLWGLKKAQRYLNKENDAQKALAKLAEIEAKDGATFTRAEKRAYKYLRGVARSKAGDYHGALEDLRFVNSLGSSSQDTAVELSEMIDQLEKIVEPDGTSGMDGAGQDDLGAGKTAQP